MTSALLKEMLEKWYDDLNNHDFNPKSETKPPLNIDEYYDEMHKQDGTNSEKDSNEF